MKQSKLILISVLVIWGVLSRTLLHVGPNIEFVTAASLIGGYIFSGSRLAFLVPLLILLPSDLLIGNTNIFLFTWTGFLFPVALGRMLKGLENTKWSDSLSQLTLGVEVSGVVSTLFFFIWTNFGHWLTTAMYSKDLNGLLQSYLNAIPFLKNQLAGNLLIVPVFMLITILALNSHTIKAGLNKLTR